MNDIYKNIKAKGIRGHFAIRFNIEVSLQFIVF